ncbi:uncharacterized protein LOC130649657 [Hydractinia symbiolongicarpus]|uniref:uncharacterized protein LOC130649657 n=1 Tax=Hydractinia symbiolongicarpus TaxID=13093 RepID=UPI002550B48F|nr:uncharacterized protein LOC130649657 [Hydractinia symbiolongicarpus]
MESDNYHNPMRSPVNGYGQNMERILGRWKNTNWEPLLTPIFKFIADYPFTSLFIGVIACFASLPLLFFFVFVVMTFLLTFCGAFIIFGTFSSFAFGLTAVLVFVAVITAAIITCGIVVVYAAGFTFQDTWNRYRHLLF